MNRFINLSQLSHSQKQQYTKAITEAFPKIISESAVIKNNWDKLEKYFPEFQQLLIAPNDEVIGFINTVPFRFDNDLTELPERGWDWMFENGIETFEKNRTANYLGGLQVIVSKKYQGLGYSKKILSHAKSLLQNLHFFNLVIPIRPTRKHEFPDMALSKYLTLKEEGKILDPWIRTHLKSGANIIKVCHESMTMTGDLRFWESILGQELKESGQYKLEGALTLIIIDVEQNSGQYIEPNIWITYG